MRNCKKCEHLVLFDYKNRSYSCEKWKCEFEPLKQEPILDKIRAEIETKYGQCKLTEHIVQYDGICTSVNDIGDIADILQIIDKYKAETEVEE